jgi:hypothetical protein
MRERFGSEAAPSAAEAPRLEPVRTAAKTRTSTATPCIGMYAGRAKARPPQGGRIAADADRLLCLAPDL